MTMTAGGHGETRLLSTAQMQEADHLAEAAGFSGEMLMERAGAAVAEAISLKFPPSQVLVLCGPGNNGGDGFVVARLLADQGWPVRVALLGSRNALTGDAARNAARWAGETEPLVPAALDGSALIVDALFGAGLSRELAPEVRAVVAEVRRRGLAVVSIDVPSGVSGDSGAILGREPDASNEDDRAFSADLTVSFFCKKTGHLLFPGRRLQGDLVIADIGLPATVLDDLPEPWTVENQPPLWQRLFPWPEVDGHKYSRGHALVCGGAPMTGAARMAARAAGRIGAGLVTVAAPEAVWAVYAASLESVIVQPIASRDAFDSLISDHRRNAVLIGPGAGDPEETRRRVLTVLAQRRSTVIDADGLTCFDGQGDALFSAIEGPCVLTPHAGEFARVFGPVGSDKLAAARVAANRSGAVVLLKGGDTVIAAPDGRAAINVNAPAFLATAGAGDVLAGLIVGLLAQRMPAFEAACAAAWIHGASAASFGPGLIAEDVIDAVPAILRRLLPPPS